MLVSTGMMFPLAVGISTLLKADWKLEDNPLNMLGLIINLAQFAYFPFIFWAFAKSPEQVVLFFAIITAAHFFPYGWYYESKAYYMIAPLVAVMITVVGWTLGASQLWLIPTVMVGSLIILATWVTVVIQRIIFQIINHHDDSHINQKAHQFYYIITIIITDTSPSTIHDSPIHV